MKRILTVLAALMILMGCLMSVPHLAADSNNPTSYKKLTLVPKNPSTRPKAPSMQQVNCIYSDGNLYFEFAFPEGQCQLLLSDLVTGETVATGFDSTSSEALYVGYHSTASLTVTTANGNTYSGMW